jgi:hypothetical protein
MIKTMYQNIYSRKKQIGEHYTEIDCYSNGVFTSNDEIPFTNASIIKRFKIIHFTSEDIATEENKEQFKKMFDMENGGYRSPRFKNLIYIGDAFFHYCNDHFNEVMNSHTGVVNNFIIDVLGLKNVNMEYQEVDTIESINKTYKEVVANQLLSDYYINDKINLDSMFSPGLKEEGIFKERDHVSINDGMKVVAKHRRIDYLYYTIDKDGEECIVIHNRINRILKSKGYSFDNMTGKTLAELFNSKDIHKVNGKSISGAKIKINELENLMNI